MIIYMLALYKLGSTLQDEDIVGGYNSISSINFLQFLPLRVSKKRKKKEEEEAILNNKKKYFFKSKNSNPSVLQFMMKK